MVAGSKNATYWKAQDESYLPRTLAIVTDKDKIQNIQMHFRSHRRAA